MQFEQHRDDERDVGARAGAPYPAARQTLIAPILLGWLVGTAVQLQQSVLLAWTIYAVILVLSAILASLFAIQLIAKRRHQLIRAIGASACAGLVAFAWCGLRASLFTGQALSPALEGQDIAVQGVIASMPQRNAGGTRFRFEVESARLAGTESAMTPAQITLPPLIYLGWYADAYAASGGLGSPELRAGQRWQWVVRLKAPHGNSNPGGFDYELWLWEQSLQATGYVRAGRKQTAPQLLDHGWRHPVEQARQQVRDLIYRAVPDRRSAGIIAALVVGDQAAIERADWDVFRATGVAHLMSISGLHVTLFAWLAAACVAWVWRRSGRVCLWLPAPHAALIGGVTLATAYAVFSGWGVPAQRTVLMLLVMAALRWHGHRWPWPLAWLLTACIVLAWDPWAGLQAGFWLSFVAVGVLFASGDRHAASAQVPEGADGYGLSRVWRAAWSLWREQWVVTVALTPLTLLLFGQFSIVGLVANLAAIPWVTVVVTPLAMLGVLWAPLWGICTAALDGLTWALSVLAALPLATYSTAAPAWWAGVAGVVGGLLWVLDLPWRTRLLGLPLVLPVLLWQAPRPPAGQFEMLAADVGQGTAVLVRTAHHALLYDAGPRFGQDSDAGHRVLVPLLRSLDERLDVLVLSHRDTDHVGGAQAVLAMQPQAAVLSSIEDGHTLQALRPVQRCLAGDRWQWDGVAFEVLHPQPRHYASAQNGKLKPNGLSCVLRVSTGERSALLTGDIEAPQEHDMLQDLPGDKLKADVLLVPHHGSKTSSSPDWVAAVSPQWAVVQSGYRNRFGHPVPAVLDRYHALGVRVAETPQCGAVLWHSAQPEAVQCQRQQRPRYWHHAMP